MTHHAQEKPVALPARLRFYDYHPTPIDFYAEVIQGLSQRPRAIGPKFFYDEYGSRLFDAICRTPEYYPTRTEIAILEKNIDAVAQLVAPHCVLIEPGSGNSRKVRILLDTIRPRAYIPIDISKAYLRTCAGHIAAQYPWLDVHAVCADYTAPLHLPDDLPAAQRLAFFPGSTIGNFEPDQAVAFLRNIAAMLQPNGGLLIGVDLKKDSELLNAAYNDKQGITAAFNLNLLYRINRELVANFDRELFHHHAFYNAEIGRIEMHLVSDAAQRVRVDGKQFDFVKGEGIHTENSYKYSIEEFQALAERAGYSPVAFWTDPDQLFSIHYCRIKSVAHQNPYTKR
jgi:dimethylhistidine N-methyltransferase